MAYRRKTGPIPEDQREAIKTKLLDDLSRYNNISNACKRCGIAVSTFFEWRASGFITGDDLEASFKRFLDFIRDELAQRALHGEERLMLSQGRVIKDDKGKPLYKRFKDTRLLERLAAQLLPEMKPVETVDVTTHNDIDLIDGVPRAYALIFDFRLLTEREVATIRAIGEDIEKRKNQKLLSNGHVAI